MRFASDTLCVVVSTFGKREWLAKLLRSRILDDLSEGFECFIATDSGQSGASHVLVKAGSWLVVMDHALDEICRRGFRYVFLVMEDHYPERCIEFDRVLLEAEQAFSQGASQVLFPCLPIPEDWTVGRIEPFQDFSNRSSLMPAIWSTEELGVLLEKLRRSGESDPWSFESVCSGLHLVATYRYPSSKDGLYNQGVMDVTNLKAVFPNAPFKHRLWLLAHFMKDLPEKLRRKFTAQSR